MRITLLIAGLVLIALVNFTQSLPSSSQQVATCLNLLSGNKSFCSAFLNGAKPPQSTSTSITTSTQTLVASTVTNTKSTTVTSTITSTSTSTSFTTLFTTITSTLLTSATYTPTSLYNRRRRSSIPIVSIPAAVKQFDNSVITNACFLLLYGELTQTPTSTTKTIIATSIPPAVTQSTTLTRTALQTVTVPTTTTSTSAVTLTSTTTAYAATATALEGYVKIYGGIPVDVGKYLNFQSNNAVVVGDTSSVVLFNPTNHHLQLRDDPNEYLMIQEHNLNPSQMITFNANQTYGFQEVQCKVDPTMNNTVTCNSGPGFTNFYIDTYGDAFLGDVGKSQCYTLYCAQVTLQFVPL